MIDEPHTPLAIIVLPHRERHFELIAGDALKARIPPHPQRPQSPRSYIEPITIAHESAKVCVRRGLDRLQLRQNDLCQLDERRVGLVLVSIYSERNLRAAVRPQPSPAHRRPDMLELCRV